MKQQTTILLALMLAGVTLSTAALAAQPMATCRTHAQAAVQAWAQGHDKQMNQYFAPVITSRVTPEKWHETWEQMEAQFGAFQKMDTPEPYELAGHEVLAARMHFSKALQPMAIMVTCDDRDRINGFRLLPAHAIPGLVKASVEPKVAGVVSHDVKVPSPLGPLPGTLTLPEGNGPFPAVVLVQGSGAHDRDETLGPNKPFRDIAIGLARHGIASLRYDKRTYVYGAKLAQIKKPFTVDQEVTDDALSALHLLADQDRIAAGRVFLLGHSLGALMAPRIGKRDAQLAGIIMLAAPARPLLDVLIEQTRESGAKAGESKTQIEKDIQAFVHERQLLDAADPAHPPQGSFFNGPQSYWLSLHDYDQVAVARKLRMPILILQGKSDFQVSYKRDFLRWKKALAGHANVSFHAYPGLSHLFRKAGPTGTAADYQRPGKVSSVVINDIAAWIKAQP
ncbi:MAG TPA: alpha/beta fold hydrolase [Rhodanobacteraceae bacterium]|nr:alpha/beta fold hydrolase [Rhodanobacteraceae bacterium]